MQEIDPVRDNRWPEFLERHEHASVFQTPEWLRALSLTYGYEPRAITLAKPGADLMDGLVFCRIRSCLTGRRTVSLPFADHCSPLVRSVDALDQLLHGLKHDKSRGKYVEIRPVLDNVRIETGFQAAATFCLHRLDLRPSLETLLAKSHPSCVRRRILKAQRENLTYQEGRSESLLLAFYRLAVLTRRRHHLPPQPLAWFRNLLACMGEKVQIRLASANRRPVAGVLTLRHKNTLTYKYGFSDHEFHRTGAMQLLLWKAITEAKNAGLTVFDWGRTDWSNPGLVLFKDRWGTNRTSIACLRYPQPEAAYRLRWPERIARSMFAVAPDRLLTAAGNLLYRHLG